jgi:hypothetical protein
MECSDSACPLQPKSLNVPKLCDLYEQEAGGSSAMLSRRRLRDAPPGYVLVSNMTANSPAAAHALARNISAALVSMNMECDRASSSFFVALLSLL